MNTRNRSCKSLPHTWPPPESAVPRFGFTSVTPERIRVCKVLGASACFFTVTAIVGWLFLGELGLFLVGGLFAFVVVCTIAESTTPPQFNAYTEDSPQIAPDRPNHSLFDFHEQMLEEQLSPLWDVVDSPQDFPGVDCDDPLIDTLCIDCAGGCLSCGGSGGDGGEGGDGGDGGGGCGGCGG